MPVKKWLLILYALFFINNTYAQVFSGTPTHVKWQQVNVANAKIVFEKGNDSFAQRAAAIINQLQQPTQNTIGTKIKPVTVLVQNRTIVPNGYVGLAPYRSEFFGTPPHNSFELGSLYWVDQLTIHEYRHLQQYSNFNVGGSKIFKILFGEGGQALANALTVPDWFFEGDAIYNETQTSWQGRGRLNYFFNDYRSLWQAGKKYPYMKLRNGSLRDFVPNHYALGYLLIAYGREKYGNDFWKNVSTRAAAMKGLLYPFQQAVKKYSGKTYQQFTNEALAYMRTNLINSKTQNITTAKHFLGDEEFITPMEDGRLLLVKSSYKSIPAFYIKDGAIEQKIRVKDVSPDNYFTYSKGKIIYASYRPDVRWGYQNFSELQVLDVNSGQQKTITKKSKYFAPAFNNNNTKIVAVEANAFGKYALHILNSEGKLQTAITNPQNYYYTYPKFTDDDNIVTAVRNKTGEMALLTVAASSEHKILLPFSKHVLGFLNMAGDTVLFTASFNGRDELFAFNLKTRELLQMQYNHTATGDYQLTSANGKYYFSRFSANGFRMQQVNAGEVQWKNITSNFVTSADGSFNIHSLDSSAAAGLLNNIQRVCLPVSKYRKSTKLFNFHSWQPLIEDPDYTFSLLGENVLNTLQSELFVRYNRNEKFKQLGYNASFGQLFTIINAGIDYTINRTGFYRTNRVFWNEVNARAGIAIPLNLSKGRSITGLAVGSNFVYSQPTFKGRFKDSIGNRTYGYLASYINFSHQIQKARQHIYPRFAQTIALRYNNMLQRYNGYQFLISSSFYFPGLALNHNIVLNAALQQRDKNARPSFSNSFPFSRGYQGANLRSMYKLGTNYHLPLVYPDWGFGNIVYCQRIRANAFYDYTNATVLYTNGKEIATDFVSTGTEIFFDTKWWNQLEINVGFRYSRLLNKDLFGGNGNNRFEFILPVNLLSR
jgi:hypothetical protein